MKVPPQCKLHLKKIDNMKISALISILILGVFSFLPAQDKQKYEYCQANVSTGVFSSIVQMDIEGNIPFKLNWNKYVMDENGKYLKVKSAAEFITIMSKYDWEFVDFFQASLDHSSINILFRRALKTSVQESDSMIKKEDGG